MTQAQNDTHRISKLPAAAGWTDSCRNSGRLSHTATHA